MKLLGNKHQWIADRLDELRLTRTWLAAACGVSYQTVWKWIKGQHTPGFHNRRAIARALELDEAVVHARFLASETAVVTEHSHSHSPQNTLQTGDDVDRREIITKTMLAALGGGVSAVRLAQVLTGPTHEKDSTPSGVQGATASLPSLTPRSLARVAAQDAVRWGDSRGFEGVPSTSLGTLQGDLLRLTDDYITTSDVSRIFAEALAYRGHLVRLIELHRLRPRDAMEVHRMLGATCLLLASISHDLGESDAGIAFTRAADASAHLAEHRELQHWSLCTRAMIELWRQRYSEVLSCAAQAASLGVEGAAAVRLKGLEVRATASMGAIEDARVLLHDFERAADVSAEPSTGLSDLGSLFTFPVSRRSYYAAVSHTLVGSTREAERYMASLGLGDGPPQTATWPVSWALGRAYLAVGRLRSAGLRGCVEGAAEALAPVLSLPSSHRIQQMSHVLGEVEQLLATQYQGASSATHLLSEVRHFRESTQEQPA